MTRIGFSVWKGDSGRIGSLIKSLIESGMDHAEVSVDTPLDIELEDLKPVLESIRDAGISLGIHLPWRELPIASPIEEIRLASTTVMMRIINELLRYEPEYFVLHGSSEQSLCSEREDLCIGYLKRSLEELLRVSDRIALETIQGSCCGKVGQIARILEDIPQLRICIDLAHVAVENLVRSKGRWPSTISEALSEVAENVWRRSTVIHLHGLKNKDRRPRTHYDFSQTPLGAEDIARAVKIWGIEYVVFEVFYRSSGGSPEPRDLSDEVRRMRNWFSLLS
ncbi:MAG TPA: TIM barrel protein [Sulfolobales archaeon]|nr:TIM barrel protein [Sulfolobales archaeon]